MTKCHDRFMNIFISTWALLMAGLVCALPMIYFRIRNHTEEAIVSWNDEPSITSQPSLNDEKDRDFYECKPFFVSVPSISTDVRNDPA